MSIFSKFRSITFIIVVLFFLVSFSVYKMNMLEKAHDHALSQQEELRKLGEKMAWGSDYLTDEIRRHVQFGDMSHYENFWNEVRVNRSRDKSVERLKQLNVLPDELAYIEKAKRYSDRLIETEVKAMDAVKRGDFDEARKLVFGNYYNEQKGLIMGNIKKFQDRVNARAQNLTKYFHDEMAFFLMLTNILLVVSGALVLFLAYGIGIKRLLNPLKYLTHVMQELAKGNLKTPIHFSVKNDEMLEMGQALKVFKENAIRKKIIELELAKANRSRSLVLESVGEGIYGLDLEGKVTFLNPMAEKLLGYSQEELTDEPAHLLFHHSRPDGTPYPIDECHIYRAFRDGGFYTVADEVYWRKDGSSFSVEYTSTPMYEKGKLTGAVVVFKDISERKRADEVLKQIVMGTSAAIGDDFLKSLVKHLATSLNVKYAFIGELGGEHLDKVITRAVWANGKLVENFEYFLKDTPCENVMKSHVSYYPNNVQSLFPKDLLLVEMGVESYLGVPLYDNEKKGRGLLVVMHDEEISESINPEAILQVFANRIEAELERYDAQMKLEKHLGSLERLVSERTAALEKSNKSLSDFAFIASHDLQEPLRKVNMFGDMLQETNQGLDEKSCDMIHRMQNATTRMQSLIDDLLRFSRLTSNDLPFVKVDCNNVIKGTLSDIETSIIESRGTVNVGELPKIDANLFQIRQLFQNLISNSLKYRKKDVDPVINISAQAGDSKKVVIKIEDNGIGFEEKYKERVFQLFQRLHGKSDYGGTGIGLAICKKIVELHNGTINVNSTPDVGTTFEVSLPISRGDS